MAVEGIDIDLQAVADIAGRLNVLNKDIELCLNGIDKDIKNTSHIWKSRAQEQLIEQYAGLSLKKEKFHKDLDGYVKFLTNTVTAYSTTEVVINNNADSFI